MRRRKMDGDVARGAANLCDEGRQAMASKPRAEGSTARRWAAGIDSAFASGPPGTADRVVRRCGRRTRPRASAGAAELALAANVVAGTATAALLLRLRGQMRWWSVRGVLRALSAGASGEARGIEFGHRSEWVQGAPLSFSRELRGKLVLLHFWTFGCFNCVHALEAIRSAEDAVDDPRFVVVSVHCGKYPAERMTAAIAEAAARLDIQHHVVNDAQLELWRLVGAEGWPSLALVGPEGNVIRLWPGEPDPDALQRVVLGQLASMSKSPQTGPVPGPVLSAAPGIPREPRAGALRHPHGVALSADGLHMYVSDSGHHRVVEMTEDGQIIRSFGGQRGLRDSSPTTGPRFCRPHGMALAEERDVLFVADTGNHAVRKVDLKDGTVTTVAGNGFQGFDLVGGKGGTDQALCSPVDVCAVPELDALLIAMAGSHQIWKCTPLRDTGGGSVCSALSGNGNERRTDSGSAATSEWAQPSNISRFASVRGTELLVADAESSSVRAIDLDGKELPTRTVVGGDPVFRDNLFAFGDVQGPRVFARFSHPLAVVGSTRLAALFIADTNNHRIKRYDLASGEVTSLCGSGVAGFQDGVGEQARFWEPTGLALRHDDKELVVVDRNNAAIRYVNTETGETRTLAVRDPPESPLPPEGPTTQGGNRVEADFNGNL